MLFNSFGFLFFFLPVVFAGFFLLARVSHRSAAVWLGLASIFFYGWWNPKFVILLLASVVFNYAMATAIETRRRGNRAKGFLIVAIVVNLGVLGVFKYANFFIATANDLWGTEIGLTAIILPLGISFFTFTQIAFLVDVYQNVAHEFDFVRYLLFVTYFPHLIAGPVLHHRQMMPQFSREDCYHVNASAIVLGIAVFSVGLAKKVLLADSFADYANPVFEAAGHGSYPRFFAAWAGALAYTYQLYFDFSGYSDMAIGLSLMFGIVLPLNFNAPYKAPNIIEFWRRWHMTLSQFLRDYLYVPLGGNRLGSGRRYVNVMITMLLGGLWHGASWTFVAWGGLHGMFLIVNHAWQVLKPRFALGRTPSTWVTQMLGVGLTFGCVVFAWVLFRADSFDAAGRMIKGMIGWNGFNLPMRFASGLAEEGGVYFHFDGIFGDNAVLSQEGAGNCVFLLVLGSAITWAFPTTQRLFQLEALTTESTPARFRFSTRSPLTLRTALFTSLLFGLSLISLSKASPFLYFQF